MKITQEQMEIGKSVLSETIGGWINGISDQVEWVTSLDVDLFDCIHLFWLLSHETLWKTRLIATFKTFCMWTWGPEFRLLKFNFDGKLSERETELFKTWILNHYSEPENAEGIFVGTFTFNDESLVVFTSRRGSSWEGVSAEVLGVYKSFDEGVRFLFEGDGEFIWLTDHSSSKNFFFRPPEPLSFWGVFLSKVPFQRHLFLKP